MRRTLKWTAVVVFSCAPLTACGETSQATKLEIAARGRDPSGTLNQYDGDQLYTWAQQICAGTFVRKADLGISDRGAKALEDAAHQELCPDRPKKGI